MESASRAELGAAAAPLATAAQQVGPYAWPRVLGDAAQRAAAAVSRGQVPGARLAQAAAAGMATLGRVAVRVGGAGAATLAGPRLATAATVLGGVTLLVWLVKHGPVRTVPVQGFGPLDRGVAPVSAEVNANTGQVVLYRGPTTQAPDTATQHTVQLTIGADGVLKDGDGRAVARLGENGQVVPMQGVDVPGLFHGPTAIRDAAGGPATWRRTRRAGRQARSRSRPTW